MDYGKISLCTLIIFYTNASDISSTSSEEEIIREWDELIDPSRDRAESADDNEPIPLSLLIPSSPRIRMRILLPEILQLVENFELYTKELSEFPAEQLRARQKIIKFTGRQREQEFIFISPLSFAISRYAAKKSILQKIIGFFNQRNIFFDDSSLLSAIQQLSFHTQFLDPDLVEMILHESAEHINDQNVYEADSEDDSENDSEEGINYSALDLLVDYLEYSSVPIYENTTLRIFKSLCLHGGKSGYIEDHKLRNFIDNSFTKFSEKHRLLAIKMLEIYVRIAKSTAI